VVVSFAGRKLVQPCFQWHRLTKVQSGAGNIIDLSGRNQIAVDIEDLIRLDRHHRIHSTAAAGATEIPVAVIAQIDVCRSIGGRGEGHRYLIVFAKAVIGDDGDRSWVPFHAVGADQSESHSGNCTFVVHLRLPDQVIKSDGSTMDVMLAAVFRHLVRFAIDRKLAMSNAIAESSDRRTKVRVSVEIRSERIQGEVNVVDLSGRVGDVDIHQHRTIVGQADRVSSAVDHGEQRNFLAVGGLPERYRLNLHDLSRTTFRGVRVSEVIANVPLHRHEQKSGDEQQVPGQEVQAAGAREQSWHSGGDPKRGQSLRIGEVPIASPFFQAALSGYSDLPMRVIARRHGASYSLCEVMLDQFLLTLTDRTRTRHFLHIADEEHPVGGQLMGSEPEQFAAGAVKLANAGFDVIDINFGCPVKKVLGRCRGGFHLSQPQTALEIVARVRDAVPQDRPVTIKMRRGMDDSDESRDNFYRILDGAFALGIAAITVHGRTVKQRYVGPSRWNFLAEVKRHVGNKGLIFGSGDLFAAEDCLRMIEQTGVDGVTIARGAIGNPWIFRQVDALWRGQSLPPPPTLGEQAEVIREHYRLCQQTYGEKRTAIMMRKFCIKYSASHPDHDTVRQQLVRITSQQEVEAVLQKHYHPDGPGRYVPREVHGSQEEGC
jgi:tRNA-dihydrouridine synthase B